MSMICIPFNSKILIIPRFFFYPSQIVLIVLFHAFQRAACDHLPFVAQMTPLQLLSDGNMFYPAAKTYSLLLFMFHSVRHTKIKYPNFPTILCHECERWHLCFAIFQQAHSIIFSIYPAHCQTSTFAYFKFNVWVGKSKCVIVLCRFYYFLLHQWTIHDLINANESCFQSCYNLLYFCQHRMWTL